MTLPVAALFVRKDGPYFGLDGVEPWDETRDARLYPGPHPVVAHPPCQRWGRYWSGGPSAKVRRRKGDDGGCFASALASVRKWGGVLEHPADSAAWETFKLPKPMSGGGWVGSLFGGWTCSVEQGNYGHRARKATWLYAFGVEPAALVWGPSGGGVRLEDGFHTSEERRAARAAGIRPCESLSTAQREETPPEFRDLLISIARSVYAKRAEVLP